tara:strand:+ start:281 stop:478 length:198 start_codon:yes stop_codon:yes gene_type:complete
MKIGDLVKHPKGIKNVCKETYAMGIVLDARAPSSGFMKQIKVMWHNKQSYLIYYEDQLEVISENR